MINQNSNNADQVRLASINDLRRQIKALTEEKEAIQESYKMKLGESEKKYCELREHIERELEDAQHIINEKNAQITKLEQRISHLKLGLKYQIKYLKEKLSKKAKKSDELTCKVAFLECQISSAKEMLLQNLKFVTLINKIVLQHPYIAKYLKLTSHDDTKESLFRTLENNYLEKHEAYQLLVDELKKLAFGEKLMCFVVKNDGDICTKYDVVVTRRYTDCYHLYDVIFVRKGENAGVVAVYNEVSDVNAALEIASFGQLDNLHATKSDIYILGGK